MTDQNVYYQRKIQELRPECPRNLIEHLEYLGTINYHDPSLDQPGQFYEVWLFKQIVHIPIEEDVLNIKRYYTLYYRIYPDRSDDHQYISVSYYNLERNNAIVMSVEGENGEYLQDVEGEYALNHFKTFKERYSLTLFQLNIDDWRQSDQLANLKSVTDESEMHIVTK